MAAQHPQEIEPLIIGRHPHPHPPVHALRHLAHQQPGREHPAIAGTDHPVARAHLFGVFQEFQRRRGGIVSRQQRLLPGRLHRHRDPAGAVGQQDHPAGGIAHARDAPDQPQPVHRGPAIDDAVAAADIQQHRLAEGGSRIRQHHARDRGQLRVQPHLVLRQQLGVLLFELHRGLFPGLHLLQLALQLGVLLIDPGIGAEALDHAHRLGDGQQCPIHVGHHFVHQRGAETLDPRAVDPPQQEGRRQAKRQHHDQDAAHRPGKVDVAVFGHRGSPERSCQVPERPCSGASLSCRNLSHAEAVSRIPAPCRCQAPHN
ncbi:hypothetical protein AKL17_0711 [Frigidibacter mobilis]|uniref:Uncharacterized protein n=1 Tax=Frigidibacter mobilis TaxID=1335048 RepID=A0A159Z1X0_9RHOB|nr:hypothetical protein AKL17_0711 [Frigidibacter mobilis]